MFKGTGETVTEIMKDLMLPSHISAILFFCGLCGLAIKRIRSKAQYLLIAGASIYLVFSNGLVAAMLIGPLEYRHPAILQLDDFTYVDTVVVLTSYAADDQDMPLSSRAGSSAAYRVLEASRLYSEGQVARVFVSGDATAATIMAELLVVTGIPATVIEVDKEAKHTVDSAIRLESYLGMSEFFLVTSAGHMPRAMGVFRANGMNPVPAPTDYQLPSDTGSASMRPTPFHLRVSDLAVHEYMGLLWYRLSGKTEQLW